MKIILNLLAANNAGQFVRAVEFINKFNLIKNNKDFLIIIISSYFPFKIKNKKKIKIIKVKNLSKQFYWLDRNIWENTKLIYLLNQIKGDIYLTFSSYLPLRKINLPTIVGISNLAPLSNVAFKKENLIGKIRLLILNRLIIFSCKRASAVLVLSNFGKKLLIKKKIEKSKIFKILIGVKKQSKKKILINNNIKKKYILYVSHFYNYKNFEQLILAYSQLSKEKKDTYRLKLVGNFYDKNYVKSLINLSKQLNIENNVDFIPGLRGKELNYIYENASLFVFASRIENSPNILLEAMSFGLPVLSTKIESAVEFSDKAIIYFKLDNSKDLSRKIKLILNSNNLMRKMRYKSLNQSKKFSWSLFVKKVLYLCRKISY